MLAGRGKPGSGTPLDFWKKNHNFMKEGNVPNINNTNLRYF
jgi:hypothetical protein